MNILMPRNRLPFAALRVRGTTYLGPISLLIGAEAARPTVVNLPANQARSYFVIETHLCLPIRVVTTMSLLAEIYVVNILLLELV